jgi:hypothetical protein
MTDTVNSEFALPLAAAVSAATSGAAFACFANSWTGILQPGLQAYFVVVDMHWSANRLLEARVCQTWYWERKYLTSLKMQGNNRVGGLQRQKVKLPLRHEFTGLKTLI